MSLSKKIIVLLFLIPVCVPPVFLAAPQPAHALFGIGDISFDPSNYIENTISAVATVLDKVNSYALVVKAYVLDPIAFVLSGNALKSITAGVVNFVNGKNGLGSPLYVQNLQQHLLNVGDQQAFSFFAEFGNSNSPFANSILSSLRLNYLQGTSAAGFWAANQCTLGQYSPNINGFLAGDFTQGGWGAWFALTTQPQNNPYTEYYRAQAELSARTASAVQNSLSQLNWGQGFLSWCGDQTAMGGDDGASADGVPESVAVTSQVNCVQSDGTPGTIQTPGSVIHEALTKVLGSDVDKIVGVGNSGELSEIFNDLGSIMSTVAYGTALFGGGSSGLAQLGGSAALTNAGYLGSTQAAIQAHQQATVNAQQQQAQTDYNNLEQSATAAATNIASQVPTNTPTGTGTSVTPGAGTNPALASPSDLTAACNANQVTLSWNAVAGADNYLVRNDDQRNNSAACVDGWDCSASTDELTDNFIGTSITYTITQGVTYSWWVHANNASGYSNPGISTYSCP